MYWKERVKDLQFDSYGWRLLNCIDRKRKRSATVINNTIIPLSIPTSGFRLCFVFVRPTFRAWMCRRRTSVHVQNMDVHQWKRKTFMYVQNLELRACTPLVPGIFWPRKIQNFGAPSMNAGVRPKHERIRTNTFTYVQVLDVHGKYWM